MNRNISRYKKKREKILKRRHYLLPFDKVSYKLFFSFFQRKIPDNDMTSNIQGARIFVIAPHQDDESLGCGGFLLSCKNKATIQPLFITNGKGPPQLRTEDERQRLALLRHEESRSVCDEIGTLSPINLNMESSELAELNPYIEKLLPHILDFEPTHILAPFYTDSNNDHLLAIRGLARISQDLSKDCKIILYRTHGQIPRKFQNSYFGLSDNIQQEKERILSIYITQKLDVDITREKYLLYSKQVPAHLRMKFKSVETFCIMTTDELSRLDSKYGDDRILKRIRSINYAPYSFKNFILNEINFLLSPFCRYGVNLLNKENRRL